MAIGEGPVVHVTPTELDWGQTPVLTDVIKIVTLSNESLIPAPFCCTLVRTTTQNIKIYQTDLLLFVMNILLKDLAGCHGEAG